jgi:drug/metabolite transporter (DMT)-like permease
MQPRCQLRLAIPYSAPSGCRQALGRLHGPALPNTRFNSPRLLFWGPTLIWASTWHVILYQLAEVPAINAVAWRFALASVLLFAIAAWRGEALQLPAQLQPWLMLTGVVQFSLNYWGVYEAERYVPSGLVAVVFSLMVFGNAATGACFFGQPITRRFALSAVVGVTGVALIFWPEVLAAGARPQALFGLAFALGAVACACAGNALTLMLSRRGVPLVPMLAWGMAYGALSLLLAAGLSGSGWRVGHTAVWWGSLVYLVAVGSVLAFLLYFKMVQREGPARAALTGMLVPVIALAVSAWFEGWQPGLASWIGMALCLGSVYAATRPTRPVG